KIIGKSSNFPLAPQDMTGFRAGRWSGGSQLFARPVRLRAWADLELTAPADGKYRVLVYLTKSSDYGIVQFYLNRTKLGKPIDTFDPNDVVNSRAINLGVAELKKGANTLRIETVGTSPKSKGRHYYWGLDCIVLQQAP